MKVLIVCEASQRVCAAGKAPHRLGKIKKPVSQKMGKKLSAPKKYPIFVHIA